MLNLTHKCIDCKWSASYPDNKGKCLLYNCYIENVNTNTCDMNSETIKEMDGENN